MSDLLFSSGWGPLAPRWWWGMLAVVFEVGFSTAVPAQGTLTILRTGTAPGPLLTATMPLAPPSVPEGAMLEFQFGFTTDETAAPGVFPDSVTASLGDAAATHFLTAATVDSSGPVWAPGGTGTLPLSASEILYETVPYPSLAPAYAQQQAWQVRVPLPPELAGGAMNFYLDLFDNGNAVASAAWFTGLRILEVPEPGAMGLGLAGLGVLLWQGRRGRQCNGGLS